jgi:hypothetical protein
MAGIPLNALQVCLVCGGSWYVHHYSSIEYPGVCDRCITFSSKLIEDYNRAAESENPRPGVPRVK